MVKRPTDVLYKLTHSMTSKEITCTNAKTFHKKLNRKINIETKKSYFVTPPFTDKGRPSLVNLMRTCDQIVSLL